MPNRILRKKLRETSQPDQVDQVLLRVQDHQEDREVQPGQEQVDQVNQSLLKVPNLPGIVWEKDQGLILQVGPELTQQEIKAILSSRWNQTAK